MEQILFWLRRQPGNESRELVERRAAPTFASASRFRFVRRRSQSLELRNDIGRQPLELLGLVEHGFQHTMRRAPAARTLARPSIHVIHRSPDGDLLGQPSPPVAGSEPVGETAAELLAGQRQWIRARGPESLLPDPGGVGDGVVQLEA